MAGGDKILLALSLRSVDRHHRQQGPPWEHLQEHHRLHPIHNCKRSSFQCRRIQLSFIHLISEALVKLASDAVYTGSTNTAKILLGGINETDYFC